jgi:hypothetical protein
MSEDGDLPDTAQALSALEKALGEALAVAPLEEVLEQVTVMFPKARVDIDTEELRNSHVKKVSVSMPEALIVTVRDRTGAGGFSRYVTDAVARQFRQDLLDDLAGELDARYGPVPPEYTQWADAVWPSLDEE